MSLLESLSHFWIDIVSCTALGAILGWVCRGCALLALILSIPVSIAWVMLGAWYAGTFSNQFSWQRSLWNNLLDRRSVFSLLPSSGNRSSFVRHCLLALSSEEDDLIRLTNR
jgi:hypothetical protein